MEWEREEDEAADETLYPEDGELEEDRESESQRPLIEAGEGEAEGFEEAERELIEHASHDHPAPDPSEFAGESKERTDAEFGEADEAESSEVSDSDR